MFLTFVRTQRAALEWNCEQCDVSDPVASHLLDGARIAALRLHGFASMVTATAIHRLRELGHGREDNYREISLSIPLVHRRPLLLLVDGARITALRLGEAT